MKYGASEQDNSHRPERSLTQKRGTVTMNSTSEGYGHQNSSSKGTITRIFTVVKDKKLKTASKGNLIT